MANVNVIMPPRTAALSGPRQEYGSVKVNHLSTITGPERMVNKVAPDATPRKQKQAATVKAAKPKDTRQGPVPSKNDKGKRPYKGPELQTRFAKALIIDNKDTEIEDAPKDSFNSEDEPAAEDSFTSATDHTAQQWKSCMEDESDLDSDSGEDVVVKRRIVHSLLLL